MYVLLLLKVQHLQQGKYMNNMKMAFADNKFDLTTVKNVMSNFGYYNARPITKAMLTWWAYTMPEQPLYSLETPLEIEHIYARNRNEKENSLTDARNVELLGNKALLEKKINIRASDYRFADKVAFYKGFINKPINADRKKKEHKLLNCFQWQQQKQTLQKKILKREMKLLLLRFCSI